MSSLTQQFPDAPAYFANPTDGEYKNYSGGIVESTKDQKAFVEEVVNTGRAAIVIRELDHFVTATLVAGTNGTVYIDYWDSSGHPPENYPAGRSMLKKIALQLQKAGKTPFINFSTIKAPPNICSQCGFFSNFFTHEVVKAGLLQGEHSLEHIADRVSKIVHLSQTTDMFDYADQTLSAELEIKSIRKRPKEGLSFEQVEENVRKGFHHLPGQDFHGQDRMLEREDRLRKKAQLLEELRKRFRLKK